MKNTIHKIKNMRAQKLCLKALGQTMSVIDAGEGETVWKFGEYDNIEEVWEHLKAFFRCSDEFLEKEMTSEEILEIFNTRRGWAYLTTMIKFAHCLYDGEEGDWQTYEDDSIICGEYNIQCCINDEIFLEKRIDLGNSWSSDKLRIKDVLYNFYVSTDGKGLIDTSDDGKELRDTSIVSEELLDKLLSVVERVASESLPLYEVFSARDASDVIENEMNADTAREFVKFACAISEEKEPQIGGDGLFEEPASFDPNSSYDISFADAYDVQITWPSDFDGDCDEERAL